MKVVKKIIYDGSPQQGDDGLEAKVKIIIGEDVETNESFFAEYNHLAIIPYTTKCNNIGEAVTAIKQSIDDSCSQFVTQTFNQ